MPKLSARIQAATHMGKTRADLMARTETITAAVDGCRVRFEQSGVKEFEYIAASDARTCDQCAAHDGKIYKLTDNANIPPLHPNCRCAIAPIVGNRKKEILESAEEKEKQKQIAKAEAAAKAKAEAEALAKAKAEAKAKQDALKKENAKLIAEIKKAKEEEIKAKAAAAQAIAFKGQVSRKEDPVIPYPERKLPKDPAPYAVKEKKTLPNAGMKHYTGSGYQSINNLLRKGTKEEAARNTTVKSWIDDVDNALNGQVISNTLQLTSGKEIEIKELYRGVKGRTGERYASANIGDEISDLGFQSWTHTKSKAEDWVASQKVKTVLIEPIQPGTPGYFVGDASTVPGEGEILRERGYIHIVTGKKTTKLNGKKYTYIKVALKKVTEDETHD